MTDKELAQRFIETLNELLLLDREAIKNLLCSRVACNKLMADHPSVQVNENTPFKKYSLGALGLLNGLVGVQDDGWGYIAAVFEVRCYRCGEQIDATIRDECPNCNRRSLILGQLIRFELVDHS